MNINSITIYLFLPLSCFLIGSIPFGYLSVKLIKKTDIRNHGSGNIGATNVARVLGKKFGILIFLLDFAKGIVPVFLAAYITKEIFNIDSTLPKVLCGLATICGHIWPIYLKFKGGKGVATGAGVFTALTPICLAIALCVWGLTVLVSKYISLGSILASLTIPITFIIINDSPFEKNIYITCFAILTATVVITKHHSNIKKLIKGTERRIGKK